MARRRNQVIGAPSFPPSIVTSWLRNDTLSGQVAAIPDPLNPASPAVQGTDANRFAGNADGSMTSSADVMQWPIHANNYNPDKIAYGFWIDPDAVASSQDVIAIMAFGGGASLHALNIRVASDTLAISCYVDGTNGRAFTTAAAQITTNPQLCWVAFDKAGANDAARLKVWINGVAKVMAVGAIGTNPELTSGLTPVTGNILLGDAIVPGPVFNYNGRWGKNLYASANKPEVTAGQLTIFQGFEPLV